MLLGSKRRSPRYLGAARFGALALAGALLASCAAAPPRFPQDVQTSVTRADMRRLETEKLILYYPEGSKSEVLRIAARLEHCRRQLELLTPIEDGAAAEKSVFVLPRMPLNNAYVAPSLAGQEQVSVVPQYNTSAAFVELGLPPDPGVIGCHEVVHDMHLRQISGVAATIRSIFGEAYTPQIGLDPWFIEGLAVYYETKLSGLGRLRSQLFEGTLAAGLAGKPLSPGKLHFLDREPNYGHYLLGAHFVDYLVRLRGEAALWQVIERQSDEALFPFGVSGRFKAVYGRSLPELVKAFGAYLQRRYPVRARPRGQVPKRELGRAASIARAASGRLAVVTYDLDVPPRLVVYDADGRELVSRNLTDLGLGRRLVEPQVELVDGLSMTADGRDLYFVAIDRGSLYQESRLVHVDVDHDSLDVVHSSIGGSGGSVSPDGARYYFSRPLGDSFAVCFHDLKTGRAGQLSRPTPRQYHVNPKVSPDGARLLVTEAGDAGVRLAIYDAANGVRLAGVAAPDGMALLGSWVDERRVVYSASDGRRMQIFETDLTRQTFRALTDAPYLAASPVTNGRELYFLNREGWRWSLDAIAHPPEPPPSPIPQVIVPPPVPITALLEGQVVASAAYQNSRAPDDRPVKELSDEPYSAFDGLFVPRLWGPWFRSQEDGNRAFGLALMGGDRLGYQRWGIAAGWNARAELPSAAFNYLNYFGAPYYVSLSVVHDGRQERSLDDFVPAPLETVLIRETAGALSIGRSFHGSHYVIAGGRYVDALYETKPGRIAFASARFAGPSLLFGLSSSESTAYGGRRRAIDLDAGAAYYPKALSEERFNLTDTRAELGIGLPLPLSRRHGLRLSGRVRALLEAPDDFQVLQLGGGVNDILPFDLSGAPPGERAAGLLPPGLRFSEALRGFEDLVLFGRRGAIGEATYTYPFIIDQGTVSTWILPAIFFRQLDFDLFFTAASLLEDEREAPLAVGTSLRLRFAFWQAPFLLQQQFARRLSHDENFAAHVFFGPGF